MNHVLLGKIALVVAIFGVLLVGASALFAFVMLRGKRLPPRGFDVLPEEEKPPNP